MLRDVAPLAKYKVVAGCEKLLQKLENRRSCEFMGRSAAQREQGGDRERGGLTPFPTPTPYFSAYISLIHPHDLNSWNRLRVVVTVLQQNLYMLPILPI